MFWPDCAGLCRIVQDKTGLQQVSLPVGEGGNDEAAAVAQIFVSIFDVGRNHLNHNVLLQISRN